MANIYYYILKVDNGVAPCIDDDIFTLAVCKPAIRRGAKKGDWILGITPKADGWKLAYVAVVQERIRGEQYYSDTLQKRSDQIYKYETGKFVLRDTKTHDQSSYPKDIGRTQTAENAWILRSHKFWYYGKNAKPLESYGCFPDLQEKLEKLGQGHRVNHSKKVRRSLDALLLPISKEPAGVLGRPRESAKFIREDGAASKHHGVC